MGTSTIISEFIGDQLRKGQRGVVFGEDHGDVGVIAEVVSEFANMKKHGISTLYVEYMSAENQGLIDKALGGNERAQKELRGLFELGWGDSKEAAQIRYNTLFEAHKAGIRVVAVDPPHSQAHVSHDFFRDTWTGAIGSEPSAERRLQTADAYITKKIKEHDDGKPFIVMYGKAHTYAANVEDEMAPENRRLARSMRGGIETRLTDEVGIPAISVDMMTRKSHGDITIDANLWADSHFVLTSEADNEKDKTPYNQALVNLGRLSRINTYLEYLADAGQLQKTSLANAEKGAHLSRHIIDSIIDGKTFESQKKNLERLETFIRPILRHIQGENESLKFEVTITVLQNMHKNDQVIALIKEGEAELRHRDARQIWNPLSGSENVSARSPLQSQWNEAHTGISSAVPQEKTVVDRGIEASNDAKYKVQIPAP